MAIGWVPERELHRKSKAASSADMHSSQLSLCLKTDLVVHKRKLLRLEKQSFTSKWNNTWAHTGLEILEISMSHDRDLLIHRALSQGLKRAAPNT